MNRSDPQFSPPPTTAPGDTNPPGAPMAQAFPRAKRTRVPAATLAETFRLADALAIMMCVTFAFMRGIDAPILTAPLNAIAPFYASGVVLAWMLAASSAYRWVRQPGRSVIETLAPLAGVCIVGAICAITVAASLGAGPRLMDAAEGLWTGVVCVIVLHCVYWLICKRLSANGALRERVAVVGVTDTAARMIARARATGEAEIVGVFHDRDSTDLQSLSGVPIVGDVMDLMTWPYLGQVDRVVICIDPLERTRLAAVLARIIPLPHRICLAIESPRLGDAPPQMSMLAGTPLAALAGAWPDERRMLVKRVMDLVGAGLGLIALSPLFALIALAIKLDSPGPVFFGQRRYGLNNTVFRIWKFRTMTDNPMESHAMGEQVQANDKRLTGLGRVLRALSLDELPQLWNVLVGDMSLVGPRPHAVGMTVEGWDPFTRSFDYAYRHRVRPGLTGLAQINGSRRPLFDMDALEARLQWDLAYVRHHGFWLDVWIMLRTLPLVFGDDRAVR